MISYHEALRTVLNSLNDYGVETVPIKNALGRVLAEDIRADRDFPAFDRATRDGITLNYQAVEHGRKAFEVLKVLPAGSPVTVLEDQEACMEIMAGAVVPYDADTVVMYEELDLENGIARLKSLPERGQNIRYRGSDTKKGAVLLAANTRISAAGVGVLASVGKAEIAVKRLPKVAVISTGNELVDIDTIPEAHQIRRSNSYALQACLKEDGIDPMLLHLPDDKDIIIQKLNYLVDEFDLLLLSGGVSQGRYDYLPEVLQHLGVKNAFHGVMQRPGKNFWFGRHVEKNTLLLSFSGNPVSAFANYQLYFRPWLNSSLGLEIKARTVVLGKAISLSSTLTQFVGVRLKWEQGMMNAVPVMENDSVDVVSLALADGFISLAPRELGYSKGDVVPFIPFKPLCL